MNLAASNPAAGLIEALERLAAIPGFLPGLLAAAAVVVLAIVLLRSALR